MGAVAQRYLFVQRRLSLSERATLQRISRGLPQLADLRTDNASFSQVGPFDVAAARPSQAWVYGRGTSHHGTKRCVSVRGDRSEAMGCRSGTTKAKRCTVG